MSDRGTTNTAIPVSKFRSLVKSGRKPGAGEFERLTEEDRARNVISKPRYEERWNVLHCISIYTMYLS